MSDSPPDDFTQAIIKHFVAESWDLLHTLDKHFQDISDGSAESPSPELVKNIKRCLHTLKGSASAAGYVDFAHMVHDWESLFSNHKQGQVVNADSLDTHFDYLQKLSEWLEKTFPERSSKRNSTTIMRKSPDSGQHGRDLLRIPPERIAALSSQLGDLTLHRLQHRQSLTNLSNARQAITEAVTLHRQLTSSLRPLTKNLSAYQRRPLERAFKKLGKSLKEAFKECFTLSREWPITVEQEDAAINVFHDTVKTLQRLPLDRFFNEFAPAIRKAGKDCKKRVRLKVNAQGIEVDRNILNKIRDPLLHLVRNAVVHGLESTEQRRRLGKPEGGTIFLEGSVEGGRATIRVSDDGAGVNIENVTARALERRLLPQAKALSDQELLDILTTPGFSTQNRVTELAGRGVGLDVVADRLREVDGYLALESLEGVGSCFSMNVPISSSSNLGLILSCSQHEVGLLFDHIERVIRVSPKDIRRVQNQDFVEVEGQSVLFLALSDLLSLPNTELQQEKQPAVVVSLGKSQMALLVDDIPGEQLMVVKALPPAFDNLTVFSGACIQPDTQVLPILNVSELFQRARGRSHRSFAIKPEDQEQAHLSAHVLVADDSITMRTLERNILLNAGYRVTTAHDGREALDLLQSQNFDLLVSDLEMPHLDGLGLCRAVRASELSDIPIVVVTSVNDDHNKQQVLLAGADAFITKREFDQNEFLECVLRLLNPIKPN